MKSNDIRVGIDIMGLPEDIPSEAKYFVGVSACGYLYFYSYHVTYDYAKIVADRVDGCVVSILGGSE